MLNSMQTEGYFLLSYIALHVWSLIKHCFLIPDKNLDRADIMNMAPKQILVQVQVDYNFELLYEIC